MTEKILSDVLDDELTTIKICDLIKILAKSTVKEVINHRLYEEIGHGTLPRYKFMNLIIQDHWFKIDWFKSISIDAGKEINDYRKSYLIEQSKSDYTLYEHYYKIWNFSLNQDLKPYTEKYVKALNDASYSGPNIGWAAKHPCRFLWREMAKKILASSNFSNENPYFEILRKFSLYFEEKGINSFKKFEDILEEYYLEANVSEKREMLQQWISCVERELEFANGIYNIK